VKQACLNALNCLVTLRLHQIEYMANDKLPDNLDNSLVFEKRNISAIRQSILTLHDDKLQLKHRKRYSVVHLQLCLYCFDRLLSARRSSGLV